MIRAYLHAMFGEIDTSLNKQTCTSIYDSTLYDVKTMHTENFRPSLEVYEEGPRGIGPAWCGTVRSYIV